MKTTEKKLEYIQLRAKGNSYSSIAQTLGISKSTCTSRERELKAEINAQKEEHLRELFSSYRLTKEARVEELGKSLDSINKALETKDLTELPADKLLDLKLRYEKELKAEYTEPLEEAGADTVTGLLEQYNRLYIDSQSGKYSPAQIKAQLSILDAKKAILGDLETERLNEFMGLNIRDYTYTYTHRKRGLTA